MNRHDWTTLTLIGVSALGSLGVTSVLYLRWADSVAIESSYLFVEPLKVPSQPVERVEWRALRVHSRDVSWRLFGDKSVRVIPHVHASYGLTLRSRPVAIPFRPAKVRFYKVPANPDPGG